MEIRFAATLAFSLVHDVQPLPISELQGDQLEDEKINPALSGHQPHSRFHGPELRMDAGGAFPGLSALRISAAMAIARVAA